MDDEKGLAIDIDMNIDENKEDEKTNANIAIDGHVTRTTDTKTDHDDFEDFPDMKSLGAYENDTDNKNNNNDIHNTNTGNNSILFRPYWDFSDIPISNTSKYTTYSKNRSTYDRPVIGRGYNYDKLVASLPQWTDMNNIISKSNELQVETALSFKTTQYFVKTNVPVALDVGTYEVLSHLPTVVSFYLNTDHIMSGCRFYTCFCCCCFWLVDQVLPYNYCCTGTCCGIINNNINNNNNCCCLRIGGGCGINCISNYNNPIAIIRHYFRYNCYRCYHCCIIKKLKSCWISMKRKIRTGQSKISGCWGSCGAKLTDIMPGLQYLWFELIIPFGSLLPIGLTFGIIGAVCFIPFVIIFGIIMFLNWFLIVMIQVIGCKNRFKDKYYPNGWIEKRLLKLLHIQYKEYDQQLTNDAKQNIDTRDIDKNDFDYLLLTLCDLSKYYCRVFWICFTIICCALQGVCLFSQEQDWGYCFVEYGFNPFEMMDQIVFKPFGVFDQTWKIVLFVIAWIFV